MILTAAKRYMNGIPPSAAVLLVVAVLVTLTGCAAQRTQETLTPSVPSEAVTPPLQSNEPPRREETQAQPTPHAEETPAASAPTVNRAQVQTLAIKLLPPQLADAQGWAEDIAASFVALSIPAESSKVCAVAAIIEQESGWQVNPAVPDLPGIARREVENKLTHYKIPSALLEMALQRKSPNGQTYAERISRLRTEQDLSRLYAEMIGELPLGKLLLSGLNPVRTGGPMQVNIGFAAGVMRQRPYPWPDPGSAREEVFTRRGGVYFGTAMLLDYPVSYDRMLYRFADFNAGRYASRNAAFQRLVAALSGRDIAPDGDLLRYQLGFAIGGSQTQTALESIRDLGLNRAAIKRDLLEEKHLDFERTALYRRVRELATQRGLPVPVASLPEIDLKSPKITRNLTTRWFAERVEGRYRQCLARDN